MQSQVSENQQDLIKKEKELKQIKLHRMLVNHNLDCLIYGKRQRKAIVQANNIYQQNQVKQLKKPKKNEIKDEKLKQKTKEKEENIMKLTNLEEQKMIGNSLNTLHNSQINHPQNNLNNHNFTSKNIYNSVNQIKQQKILINANSTSKKVIQQPKPVINNITKTQKNIQNIEINKKMENGTIQQKNQKQQKIGRAKKDQALKKMQKLEENSDSISSNQKNWKLKKKVSKPSLIQKKTELNKIFRKENATLHEYPSVKLDVNFELFSFKKFTQIFGQFDMILVSQNIKQAIFLDIQKLSKKGFIFIWASKNEVNLGYHVLNKWGYEVIDQIVWVRTQNQNELVMEDGDLFLNSLQICLVGYKCVYGEHIQYKTKISNNLIFSKPQEFRKPNQIYQIMQMIMPGGKKIELFGEGKPGWFALKNNSNAQIPKEDKKFFYEKFSINCNICKISEIYGDYFTCKDCKQLNVCQQCFFNQREEAEKIILTDLAHKEQHKWQINFKNSHKLKTKQCFGCQTSLSPNQLCYICQNCYNIYICLNCFEEKKIQKGNHCHSDEHHLTLLV